MVSIQRGVKMSVGNPQTCKRRGQPVLNSHPFRSVSYAGIYTITAAFGDRLAIKIAVVHIPYSWILYSSHPLRNEYIRYHSCLEQWVVLR